MFSRSSKTNSHNAKSLSENAKSLSDNCENDSHNAKSLSHNYENDPENAKSHSDNCENDSHKPEIVSSASKCPISVQNQKETDPPPIYARIAVVRQSQNRSDSDRVLNAPKRWSDLLL